MSVITAFEESQKYMNYHGELDFMKASLYLPIILNKKYINVVGNPYSAWFQCRAMTKTTGVMWRVLDALESTEVIWKTPRRVEHLL